MWLLGQVLGARGRALEVLSVRVREGRNAGMWTAAKNSRRDERRNKTLQLQRQWKNTSQKQTLRSAMCSY